MFTTFLITIDLSSFAIELQGGQQYVVGVTEAGRVNNWISGGGYFRIIGSRATGFEDLFQQWDTPVGLLPGYLNSQIAAGKDQHAGSLSMTVVPEPGNSMLLAAGSVVLWLRRRRGEQ